MCASSGSVVSRCQRYNMQHNTHIHWVLFKCRQPSWFGDCPVVACPGSNKIQLRSKRVHEIIIHTLKSTQLSFNKTLYNKTFSPFFFIILCNWSRCYCGRNKQKKKKKTKKKHCYFCHMKPSRYRHKTPPELPTVVL